MSIPALIQTYIFVKDSLMSELTLVNYHNQGTWRKLDELDYDLFWNGVEVFGKSRQDLEQLLTEKILEVAEKNSNIKLKKISFKKA